MVKLAKTGKRMVFWLDTLIYGSMTIQDEYFSPRLEMPRCRIDNDVLSDSARYSISNFIKSKRLRKINAKANLLFAFSEKLALKNELGI